MPKNELSFKPKELGPQILEAAQELRKKEFSGEVVKQVSRLLSDRQQQLQNKELASAEIAFIDAKLEAVEKGGFTLNAWGVITFNDPSLNRK